MTQPYGKITFDGGWWRIEAQPHILLRLKRVFERLDKGEFCTLALSDTPENCRDLEWFTQRYPLSIDFMTRSKLKAGATAHREHILTMEEIADPDYQPRGFNLSLPLRGYQGKAVEMFLKQGHLLLGDDVGLGKTAVGIGSLSDPRTLPAIVVTKTFLPRQWQDEIKRFAPGLHTHIIDSVRPYQLAKWQGRTPDVLIINYHKLSGWAEVLASYCRYAIFDECQELRREESDKYKAAKHIASRMKFCIGLSATPIYGYGGEIYNVLDVLKDGCLGTKDEFAREWCQSEGNGRLSIRDPKAFGTYLRENFLMLRRKREDVGRELPPINKIVQRIDSNTSALIAVERSASELARIILAQNESQRGEKMNASQQLSNLLRQATGIAKAPFVAAFVRMLVENGERVLLGGWHREVYTIWQSEMKDLRTSMFTGTESLAQKQMAKEDFINGKTDVLMMSLRSGEGIDGLQGACKTVVIGELDWAPGVHEQFVGRIHRDGQREGVTVYFLLADDGADPIMADVLGLKRQQIEGIRNPKQELIEKIAASPDHVRRLAEAYLQRRSA